MLRFRNRFIDAETLDLRFVYGLSTRLSRCDFAVHDGQNRFHYLIIARAAAEVARHPFLDFVFARIGIDVEQRLGGDDLTGGADAALEAAVFDERLLKRMQRAVFGEPFDRFDLLAIAGDRERQARAHEPAVHRHAARAADADAAAFLGAGEADVFADRVQQKAVRLDLDIAALAVDDQCDGALHYSDLPECVLPHFARIEPSVSPSPTGTREMGQDA